MPEYEKDAGDLSELTFRKPLNLISPLKLDAIGNHFRQILLPDGAKVIEDKDSFEVSVPRPQRPKKKADFVQPKMEDDPLVILVQRELRDVVAIPVDSSFPEVPTNSPSVLVPCYLDPKNAARPQDIHMRGVRDAASKQGSGVGKVTFTRVAAAIEIAASRGTEFLGMLGRFKFYVLNLPYPPSNTKFEKDYILGDKRLFMCLEGNIREQNLYRLSQEGVDVNLHRSVLYEAFDYLFVSPDERAQSLKKMVSSFLPFVTSKIGDGHPYPKAVLGSDFRLGMTVTYVEALTTEDGNDSVYYDAFKEDLDGLLQSVADAGLVHLHTALTHLVVGSLSASDHELYELIAGLIAITGYSKGSVEAPILDMKENKRAGPELDSEGRPPFHGELFANIERHFFEIFQNGAPTDKSLVHSIVTGLSERSAGEEPEKLALLIETFTDSRTQDKDWINKNVFVDGKPMPAFITTDTSKTTYFLVNSGIIYEKLRLLDELRPGKIFFRFVTSARNARPIYAVPFGLYARASLFYGLYRDILLRSDPEVSANVEPNVFGPGKQKGSIQGDGALLSALSTSGYTCLSQDYSEFDISFTKPIRLVCIEAAKAGMARANVLDAKITNVGTMGEILESIWGPNAGYDAHFSMEFAGKVIPVVLSMLLSGEYLTTYLGCVVNKSLNEYFWNNYQGTVKQLFVNVFGDDGLELVRFATRPTSESIRAFMDEVIESARKCGYSLNAVKSIFRRWAVDYLRVRYIYGIYFPPRTIPLYESERGISAHVDAVERSIAIRTKFNTIVSRGYGNDMMLRRAFLFWCATGNFLKAVADKKLRTRLYIRPAAFFGMIRLGGVGASNIMLGGNNDAVLKAVTLIPGPFIKEWIELQQYCGYVLKPMHQRHDRLLTTLLRRMGSGNATWKDKPFRFESQKMEIEVNGKKVTRQVNAAVLNSDGEPHTPFDDSKATVIKMISPDRLRKSALASQELAAEGISVPRSLRLTAYPDNLIADAIKPMRRNNLALFRVSSAASSVSWALNKWRTLRARNKKGFVAPDGGLKTALGWMSMVSWSTEPGGTPELQLIKHHPYQFLDTVISSLFRIVGLVQDSGQGLNFKNKILQILRQDNGIPRKYTDNSIINLLLGNPHLFSRPHILTLVFQVMGASQGNASLVADDLFRNGPSFLSADSRGISEGDLIISSMDLTPTNVERLVSLNFDRTFITTKVGALIGSVALVVAMHLALPYDLRLALTTTSRLQVILTTVLNNREVTAMTKNYIISSHIFGDSAYINAKDVDAEFRALNFV
jgi:hypothetical protein